MVQKAGWNTVVKSKEDLVWFRMDNIFPKIDIIQSLGVVGIPG